MCLDHAAGIWWGDLELLPVSAVIFLFLFLVQICAVGSIIMNKASGGDGIPAELFQILKDDAVKVLHSICQQI